MVSSSTGDYVGGVAGYVDSSTLEACYSTGDVSGSGSGTNVGGIAGYVGSSSTVQYCASVSNEGTYGIGIGIGTIIDCTDDIDTITKADHLNSNENYGDTTHSGTNSSGAAWTAPKLSWQQ